MNYHAFVGVMMLAIGLFELLGTPLILRRLWGKGPLPHSEYLFRTIRLSGFVVSLLGILFLLGFF